MIRIAIIEDEPLYCDELACLLRECAGSKTMEINCFASGEEFLESGRTDNSYAAVFVDIELKGINGLELARIMRSTGYKNMLVFTTNYEQYVYDGYEVEAFRYLRKPVKKQDVQSCLDRVSRNMREAMLVFSFNRKKYSISYRDIIYISSYGHYLTIHTAEQDYKWKYLIKDLQPHLPEQFIRCHRSFVVNLDFMRKLDGKRLVLKNGGEIDVAGNYLPSVRKAITSTI